MNMRSRFNQLAVAVPTCVALLGSAACSAETAERPAQYDVNAPITAEDQAVITKSFKRMQGYWTKTGSAAVQAAAESTQLVILTGGQTFVCGDPHKPVKAGNPAGTGYCPPANSVIITQGSVNMYKYMIGQSGMLTKKGLSSIEAEQEWLDWTVGHEFGHLVQNAEYIPFPPKSDEVAYQAMEKQADCAGGVAVTAVDPDASAAVTYFYDQMGTTENDATHGTRFERERAFREGATGGLQACQLQQ
jgi:hypothetical protein